MRAKIASKGSPKTTATSKILRGVVLTENFVKNVKMDFEILFQLSEKAAIRCSLFFKLENVYLCEK